MTKKTLVLLCLGLSLHGCTNSSLEAAEMMGGDAGPSHPDASHPDAETRTPEPASFELLVDHEKMPVLQGTSGSLEVRVRRSSGFHGAVAITHSALPAGCELETKSIAAGEDTVTLRLRASSDAPHSLPTTVELIGSAASGEARKELTVTVYGPPGSLDQSFAGGKVVIPMGASDDEAHGVAVQADGKIVVVGQSSEHLGDFAILRLTRDGARDPEFGVQGIVTTQVGSGQDTAYAVALQPDGKILVAGTSDGGESKLDFALVRYERDGTLDVSFGQGGKVTTAFSNDTDTAFALALQADGKIVLAGESNQGSSATGVDFALARYLPSGELDPSFSGDGKLTTPIVDGSGQDAAYAVILQDVASEQRILVAGGEGDFALARYRQNGELDPEFGHAGIVKGLFGSAIGAARALALTERGQIVVAGHDNHDFALARLRANGELDGDFGQGGRVVTALQANNWDEAHGVAVDDDGRIVLGGWAYEGNSSAGNFALARYTQDGRLDLGFGEQGIVIQALAGPQKRDEGHALALQRDERVPTVRAISAGFASEQNYDFAVMRSWL